MTFFTCYEESAFDWRRSLIVALVILVSCVELGSGTALAAAGDLLGPIRVIRRPGEDEGRAVAVQPDGNIVVAGSTDQFGTQDFQVVRLTATGSLIRVQIERRAGEDEGRAVAVQPDGNIVVAGSTDSFRSQDFQLVRFSAAGSLLRRQVIRQAGEDSGRAVAIQDDGKIVLAGSTDLFGSSDFQLMRFNPDGSLDRTFSGGYEL